MKQIKIEDKLIGKNQPPFVIAEVGQAHEGSLAIAHSFIEAVHSSGADAIKFQTHIANAESTIDEKFRKKFPTQDKNRYEYWKRMEFSYENWKELKDHAIEKGLIFLSSPFSVKAFELLNKLDISAWKIGSGEYKSDLLINKMIDSKKPILLSTGMNYTHEIDKKVKFLKEKECDFAVFQCTSQYPTSPENVGLNFIKEFINNYGVPVGLSDHTGNIFSSLASFTLGVNLVELHVTFDKKMFGPDASSSINFDQLKLLIEGRDEIFKYMQSKKSKNQITDNIKKMRSLFTKSLAFKKNMKKGQIIRKDDITVKKPGTGISIENISKIIGKKLMCDVDANRLIKIKDIQL